MSRRVTMTVQGGALVPDADAIALLRRLLPDRALTWSEAHSIAERQAALLLGWFRVQEPPVPQFVISSLPGIVVDWRADWPASGTAVRARSHWRIVLRKSETRQRQRFSLAHEFKHVLDDHVIEHLNTHLPASLREERAERLCNYFAACLLMPRPWIKHDYCGGIQNVSSLAQRYFVSREAMTTRLEELGLVGAPERTAGRRVARRREACE